MVPAGLRDHSTTTTAVTRRIALPAAVTGVTADTWNVTGYVASGVASHRKEDKCLRYQCSLGSFGRAQRSACKKSRGNGNDNRKNPRKTKFVFRVIRPGVVGRGIDNEAKRIYPREQVQTRRAAIKLETAVALRAVQAGNRKLERATAIIAVTDVAGAVRPCGISDPLFGFENPPAHRSKISPKGHPQETREKSNK
ncbi:hypothetical protein G5I_09417 [Acromyrmex echinatior]|uniref:Uncharacterized protein n=1 Tax=Acromyrmex echinatior TaxID=103372 RepID=F4WU62_ACREC|nr:hypothetical protein G5I_09417 [Acromyrmex echinatior]